MTQEYNAADTIQMYQFWSLVYRPGVDLSCYPLIWNITLNSTTTYFNAFGLTYCLEIHLSPLNMKLTLNVECCSGGI